VLPRLFDAFEQADSSITRQFGGLGLGLAITKALVQLHGGSISASSEGPEKGATFELRFPTANPPDAPTPDFQGRSGTTPRRSYRLLIVEDHADTQHSLTRLLERRGYEVRAVDGIGTAIEASQAFPFDVLISDMGLPDGTGIDLIQRLSADRRINAIALSGFGMEDDVRRSKDAGFAEHLTKPVDINKLDCVIQRIGADLPS
jgi:two-component system CheB/CheR fusion protein